VTYSTRRPHNTAGKIPAPGTQQTKKILQSNAPKDPFSDLVSFRN